MAPIEISKLKTNIINQINPEIKKVAEKIQMIVQEAIEKSQDISFALKQMPLRYQLLAGVILGGGFMKGQIDPNRDQNTVYFQNIHAVMDTETANLGAADNELNFNKGATTIQTAFSADTRLNHIVTRVDREHAPDLVSWEDPAGDSNLFYSWVQDTTNNADQRDFQVFFNKTLTYEGYTPGNSPNNGWVYSVVSGGYDSGTTQAHEYGWATGAAAGYGDGTVDIVFHSDGSSIGFPSDFVQSNGKTLERPNTGGPYINFYTTSPEYSTGNPANGGDGFIYFTSNADGGLPSWVAYDALNNPVSDTDGQSTTTGFANYYNTYDTLRDETELYNPETGQNETITAPTAPQFTQEGTVITLTNANDYNLKITNTTDPNFAGIYNTTEKYEFYLYPSDNVANDQYVAKIKREQLENGLDISTLGLDESQTYRLGVYSHYSNAMDFTTSVSGQLITFETQDTEDPVPDNPDLPELSAQCQLLLADVTTPTATDNVDGTITATTETTFPITQSSNIEWKYTDSSGNITIQYQAVSINDTEAPSAPANLGVSDITENSATLSFDASSDNCDTSLTYKVYLNDSLFQTVSNNNSISLTGLNPGVSNNVKIKAIDGSGNISNQTSFDFETPDTTDPVPDNPDLPELSAQCQLLLADVTTPTATDNVDGTITATTETTFPITLSGNIEWKYTDSAGNITIQYQAVSINDTEAPSAAENIAVSDITNTSAELSFDPSTDNCDGNLTYNVYLNEQIYTTTDLTTVELTDLTPNTNYTVNIVSVDGSGNPSGESVDYEFMTQNLSTTEQSGLSGLELAPNPTKGNLIIRAGEALDLIQIHNIQGQAIEKIDAQGNTEMNIDLRKLTTGVYIISIKGESGKVSHKKVIKK